MTRVVIIVAVILIAVFVFLLVRAIMKSSRRASRPSAPDDDLDFLRGLNIPPADDSGPPPAPGDKPKDTPRG